MVLPEPGMRGHSTMWCGRSVCRCGDITSSFAVRAAAVMTEAGTWAGGRRRSLVLVLVLVPVVAAVAGAACAEAADLDDGTDAGELALTPIFSRVCVEYVDGPCLGD